MPRRLFQQLGGFMYTIVLHINGERRSVVSTDSYIDAIALQREYSIAYDCAVSIVKRPAHRNG